MCAVGGVSQVLGSPENCLQTVRDADFLVDIRQMSFDRIWTYVKLRGNFLVVHPCCNKGKYLNLSRGQGPGIHPGEFLPAVSYCIALFHSLFEEPRLLVIDILRCAKAGTGSHPPSLMKKRCQFAQMRNSFGFHMVTYLNPEK